MLSLPAKAALAIAIRAASPSSAPFWALFKFPLNNSEAKPDLSKLRRYSLALSTIFPKIPSWATKSVLSC